MAWEKNDIISYYNFNDIFYRIWGSDMHYGYWDENTRTLRQATRRFDEILAQNAHISKTDRVLDAGCGVGGASIFLAETIGCHVDGVTICPRQVIRASRNARKRGVQHLTEFHEMDYSATSFPDGYFDVVWGLESICYAPDKQKFVSESFRVLRKGGRLIIADGFDSKERYDDREKECLHKFCNGWIVNKLDTPWNFAKYAKIAGFKSTSYENVTDRVMPTSRLMFGVSMLFLPLHILSKFIPIKSYPTDALFHQYRALKRGLWEYGIFLAEK